MSLEERFEEATKKSKTLPHQSNENLLKIYSLFKQATQGDVSGARPGGFDFKGMAKYDAWAGHKGKSQDQAREEYIEMIDNLAGWDVEKSQ